MVNTIKNIRQTLNLTQQQVSLLTGIPINTLRNWEQNLRKPSQWTLDLIIDRLLRIKLEEQMKIDQFEGILSFLTIKENVSKLAKNYNVDKIYLFGSYALGNPRDDSDIDIYMESDLYGLDYFGFAEKLREDLHKKIDLLSNNTIIPNSQIENKIKETGILIYER